MEDGNGANNEGYQKPELTKHEDLTQVTFSSHDGSKPKTTEAQTKFVSPAAAILSEPYEPRPNNPKSRFTFGEALRGKKDPKPAPFSRSKR